MFIDIKATSGITYIVNTNNISYFYIPKDNSYTYVTFNNGKSMTISKKMAGYLQALLASQPYDKTIKIENR